MKIKDLKKWISDISSEFDEYTLTHREYYDSEDDTLFANEVPMVSVHIDDNEMKACFMHEQSYLLYNQVHFHQKNSSDCICEYQN